MTTLVLKGIPLVMAQSESYALPARPHIITADAALELSLDNDNWVANTATTTGMLSGWAFARCTASTATILCK